jgi:hypothetical protein
VISLSGEDDLAQAAQEHIASIAVSDHTGWEELILIDPASPEDSERDALKRLTTLIKERDPDVIEGHDLFRFDLPYLVARARKAKVKLDWGRSGGFLRSRPSRLQIAEKTIDYPKFTVDGRHFVDTFLLAHFYDVGMRSLSGFERIDVAQHFGLCDSAEFSSLGGKNSSAPTSPATTASRNAPSAPCARPAPSPISSRPATSSRRAFSPTTTRTSSCAATPPASTPSSSANTSASATPSPSCP